MKTFTEKDMASFGDYLLSNERKELVMSHPQFYPEKLNRVGAGDWDSWCLRQGLKQEEPKTMRIIKQGSVPLKESKRTCLKCKTKFAYGPNDIQSDRDGRYVVCPTCGQFIHVGS